MEEQDEEDEQGMTPHNDTHTQLMKMMWEYYKQFDYIMGRQICHKAGIRIQDLKLGRACLNFILGGCNKEGCTEKLWHPKAADASPEEVNELCNKLRPGVHELTREKRRRVSR